MLLKSITLKNFLSFGDEQTLELGPLNVIIGANGAGKSNLIDALSLFRENLSSIKHSVNPSWIWKGIQEQNPPDSGESFLSVTVHHPEHDDGVRYQISFSENPDSCETMNVIKTIAYPSGSAKSRSKWADWLSGQFDGAFVYKGLQHMSERKKTDFILKMSADDTNRLTVLDALSALQEGITDFGVEVDEYGGVHPYVQEGERVVSAPRLSSGMRRWLYLLAILYASAPPPLIIIEHPEQGLHPDVLSKLAELLKAASERSQVIVTTHSDILLDALTAIPESIVVADTGERGTRLTRLDTGKMKHWLKKYRLGELWMRGKFGGVRW